MPGKIEKNVNIPAASKRYPDSPYPDRYPFDEMEIGDSFVVPLSERARLTSLAGGYKSKNWTRWNYITRTIDGNVRIWRIGLSPNQLEFIREQSERAAARRAEREADRTKIRT